MPEPDKRVLAYLKDKHVKIEVLMNGPGTFSSGPCITIGNGEVGTIISGPIFRRSGNLLTFQVSAQKLFAELIDYAK